MLIRRLALVSLAIATILAAGHGMAQRPRRNCFVVQAPPGPAAQPSAAQQLAAHPPFFATLKEALEIEKRIALPITKFYDTPNPLPQGKPGDLIRSEEFTGYSFPFNPDLKSKEIGMQTVRFLYHSRSVSGQDVPASGVILIPYGKPPAGGWPVIVWAHGTSGVGRQFAPSLMKDLYYSWEGLLQWVMLGYAVVAVDYAGLGTNVPHQYLTPPAQAQDVINAVPAARKAVKELGAKWVLIGHSQGAGAAICVAEKQATTQDPNYLGAIALAPVGDLLSFCEHIHNAPCRGYIGFMAYGIRSVFPDFKCSDILTPDAMNLMRDVDKGGWFVTLAAFSEKVPPGKVLKPTWERNAHFQKFRELSLLGNKPTFGPVLLIQGEEDEAIPTRATDALHQRMLKQKSSVQYKKYPGLDHDPLMFGS